ncbi:Mitochondrial substrate/solute carrier [Penicillium italicum]|uniref:Mitochondrial substrate/solute carrier n=1 Tax=Penicillium italicum TaxID=40296 RepID=A0A0A2KZZ4_PENIT|nr:Mitochondrial substrate/solute carrier [Penicillium italicum]
MDTVITRMQSPLYSSVYKHVNGTLSRTLFSGLYQGFGPIFVAGTLSSVAFFTAYEASKTAFDNAQSAGYILSVPRPLIHIASSAVAELLACAIQNPAEVLKQNAQVYQRPVNAKRGPSPTTEMMRQFRKYPSGLWAGYSALVASQLPSMCLTFCLYEMFKENLLERWKTGKDDVRQQIEATVLSAGSAGGCASWFFVPIHVVKTRMRLAAGEQTGSTQSSLKGKLGLSSRVGAFYIARDVLRKEGVAGLFRGSALTCVAAVVGSGIYIGCYEGAKIYLCNYNAS